MPEHDVLASKADIRDLVVAMKRQTAGVIKWAIVLAALQIVVFAALIRHYVG
jgi:hypothetical protein